MIQSLIHRFLKRRHFWRYATFSEVAELYASRTIRLFALRMVAVFTAIYLLQQGYDLEFQALFWAAFFFYKVLFAWPAALIVARVGPKHASFIANVLAAISLVFLPFTPTYGIWALALWCVFQASSTCLYNLSFQVDFSKVKSIDHNGKEIAFMNILEKIASALGPIVGGAVAFVAGPEVVMIVAAALFILAAIPLFLTAEPIKTHQALDFRNFPWRTSWRGFIAQIAVGFDMFVSGTVWILFIATVIFTSSGNDIYAKVGLLASVSLIAALVSSYWFGKLIDHRRGFELLKAGTLLNSVTHFMRATVSSPTGVVFSNITNEGATTAYTMAFTRGLFDMADVSGKRVAYLFVVEMMLNLGAALGAVLFGLILTTVSDESGLRVFFVVSSVVTLLIMTPRFPLYRK